MPTKILTVLIFNIILILCAKPGWYKNAVFYHVYPRSFKDSNNDGIGDLSGITEKLHHLSDLGVTVAWLSPIFKSPQIDHGYDVSDYYTLDPIYGNLNDLTELLRQAEMFGIKIFLDLVPNHTSDQHYWFNMSVHCEPVYKDYYVWVDPKFDGDGKRIPPNNWISVFSNSSWTWNESRQQYYLHQFDPTQPDLNLRNKNVVDDLKRVLAFYLDLGVHGFRIDAAPYLIEDEYLRDEPFLQGVTNPDPENWFHYDHIYTKDTDESFELVYEFRNFIDEYNKNHDGDEIIIVTESYSDFDKTMLYYGNQNGTKLGAHFTFNFDFTYLHFNSTAKNIKSVIEKWISALYKKYPYNWGLSNHDNHRGPTKLGNIDGYNMLVTFLPGVAAIYYGEEIGQENGEVECEEGTDPKAVNNCTTFHLITRDYERTPFQWDSTVNAGFNTGGKPWLPISRKFRTTNLESQNVPGLRSHYNIYKDMIKLRKQIIDYDEVYIDENDADQNVLHVVRRRLKGEDWYVLLFNMERSKKRTVLAGRDMFKIVVSSTHSQYTNGYIFRNGSILLLPQESLVLKRIEAEDSTNFSSNSLL